MSQRKLIPKVAAIVVTYNRLALLKEAISALDKQTTSLTTIYIIDNNSTDGTQAWFESSKYAKKAQFHFVQVGQNLGGAGGFAAGIAEALKSDYDWLWLMDDDSICHPSALANLLQSRAASDKKVVVLASKVVGVDNEVLEMNWQVRFDPRTGDMLKIASSEYDQAEVAIEGTSFVGFLVRTSAVKAIGLPRADFFIHFDDWEYCLRIWRAGYKKILVNASVITHKLTVMKKDTTDPIYVKPAELWKHYYGQRNEIYGLPFYISPWYCNLEFRARRLYWVVKRSFRYLRYDHSWLRITIEWQAWIDANLGRLGKRIDPATFKQRL